MIVSDFVGGQIGSLSCRTLVRGRSEKELRRLVNLGSASRIVREQSIDGESEDAIRTQGIVLGRARLVGGWACRRCSHFYRSLHKRSGRVSRPWCSMSTVEGTSILHAL